MRQHLSQVAHVEQRSADRAIAEMIGLGFGNAVGVDGLDGRLLSSLIPRQLPASPMLVLPRRVEHTFNAAVQGSHDANSRKHRWPSQFRGQHQALNRGLPFRGE